MPHRNAGIIVCLAAALAGGPAWAAQGQISKAVLGSGAAEDMGIVNPATTFSPDTPKVVCGWEAEGVRPGAHIRAVWIAEDTGGAAPMNFKIDESTFIADTPKKVFEGSGTFSISRPTKGWPAGRYRLEIYLESDLARTVRFTIAGTPQPVVAKITAAELGTDRTADLRLVNPGTAFPADAPRIVCAWKSVGIRPGVVLRSVWIAEDTGGADPPNFVVGEISRPADASFDQTERTGEFHVEQPPRGWSPGRYRVEIYLGQELAKTIPFTIQPKAARVTLAVLGTGRTEKFEIVNPTSEFPPDVPKIYCVWRSEGLKPGTPVHDRWIAEDTGPSRAPNRKIAEGTTTQFTRGAFTLSSPSKHFAPGRYRLEIYFGDELVRTVPFTIKPD